MCFLLIYFVVLFENLFVVLCLRRNRADSICPLHISTATVTHFFLSSPHAGAMKQFTAEQKHEILLEYSPQDMTRSFSQLARRHSVAGGERTVRRWFSRWNRTATSLQHKKGAGRPRVLTQTEVQRYIAAPIRRLNRSFRRARYGDIAQQLRKNTGKQVNDRTVRNYGKEQLGIKKGRGKKRTAEESKCKHTLKNEQHRVFVCGLLS